jgi:hypothetical protein
VRSTLVRGPMCLDDMLASFSIMHIDGHMTRLPRKCFGQSIKPT